jgi:3-oxoacyl-[acyl-carrier-protein] synthase II
MKIVVTGLGAHCALGENIKTLWNAIEQGKSGIVPINRFNVEAFDTQLGAMVPSDDCCGAEAQRLLAYGGAAASEALQHAKIVDPSRVALVLGTCNGLLGREIYTISTDLVHAVKLGGPAITLSTACASSVHAIGFAADLVRREGAEFVLAGGVDILSLEIFAGFHSLGLQSKIPCAPFSTDIGTTLGEGAAFMVLESERSAKARGATPLAEFMGYGISADAFHDTTPDPSGLGMSRALTVAVEEAGLVPENIDYLNAHGTGTAANDAAEWRAIRRAFGDYADRFPVSSSKSFLGHAQGAAGALEAVVTLMAMKHNVVPPTINLIESRPNAPTDPVASPKPRPHVIRHTVCANAGFGGVNAALVFGQVDEMPQRRREIPRPISLTSTGIVQDGHQVNQFAPRTELRGIDMSARLLAGATGTALANAGVRTRTPDCERIGLFVGQTRVSPESVKAFDKSVQRRGLAHLSASAFTRMVCNYATGVCCRLFGLKGPTATLSTGVDSGLTALILAADHLAWRDDANYLLAAGVDEPDESDNYENGAAAILLKAGEASTPIILTGWALATNCELATEQALAKTSLNREEIVPMTVTGPPTIAGLWAVIAAMDALKAGEKGPFLISNRGEGSVGAAVILETGSKECNLN